MFTHLAASIQRQDWCARHPRFVRLDNLDRLLDGTFYDHLPYGFYDETEPSSDQPIPLSQKRPSAQFRLPRFVARWASRKLFSGRHAPRISHTDDDVARVTRSIARSSKIYQRFALASFLGSVGSVALTFRVDPASPASGGGSGNGTTTGSEKTALRPRRVARRQLKKGAGDEPRVAISVWRAKELDPAFDSAGELSQLRLRRLATASDLASLGYPTPEKANPGDLCWFVRDWTPQLEVTYVPVLATEWNPVDGFTPLVDPSTGQPKTFVPWPDHTYEHALGFVPAVWVMNLAGDAYPDGDSTFADAVPNSIDLDYNLSQLGRGVRYNAAPQLWISGEIRNEVVRGPLSYLHLDPGQRSEDGEVLGKGTAGLLEMSGTGVDAGLRLLEFERDLALEQVAASRKNPERLRGILSGRAMEFLEEDSSDLVAELRTQYGDFGLLPLLRRICVATNLLSHDEVAALSLQWPRLFQPTAAEMAQLIPALRDAVTPIIDPATVPVGAGAARGPRPTQTNARSSNGGQRPSAGGLGVRGTFVQEVKTIGSLMDLDRARAFIEQALDLAMLDEDAEDFAPEDLELPNEVPSDAPPSRDPDPILTEDEDPNAAATDPSGSPTAGPTDDAFGMRVGPPVTLPV